MRFSSLMFTRNLEDILDENINISKLKSFVHCMDRVIHWERAEGINQSPILYLKKSDYLAFEAEYRKIGLGLKDNETAR